ncbi:MAG: flavodoxin family protein [Gammaproteobacteria bacterium]|nr:flavodoxin family protein [Gammaproteobacteria bacterium]
MTTKICIVYHSGYGHTAKQAAAVADGAREVSGTDVSEVPVEDLSEEASPAWEKLDAAEAIVFGCPTYMACPSAGLKQFMEATSGRWMSQQWADKLAAGFTNSGSQNGDKQNTLVDIATFAAQHGMVWINLNLLPGNNSSAGSVDDLNRLGASLGAMAQSNVDEAADVVPPKADLDTARSLGERVAKCAQRWSE